MYLEGLTIGLYSYGGYLHDIFFEGIYFWRSLNFESLISEVYGKYNL